tara:strand:+ start:92 stop:244 length:153 start_codon:yes stop_codon:yes gene_type:complete
MSKIPKTVLIPGTAARKSKVTKKDIKGVVKKKDKKVKKDKKDKKDKKVKK